MSRLTALEKIRATLAGENEVGRLAFVDYKAPTNVRTRMGADDATADIEFRNARLRLLGRVEQQIEFEKQR